LLVSYKPQPHWLNANTKTPNYRLEKNLRKKRSIDQISARLT